MHRFIVQLDDSVLPFVKSDIQMQSHRMGIRKMKRQDDGGVGKGDEDDVDADDEEEED